MATRTLVDTLLAQAQQRPGDAAITFKRGGSWRNLTWRQVEEEVQALSAGLVAFGVKPGDRVAIFADTSLEWVLFDYAIQAAGGVVVPIYGSNTSDETRYVLENSGALLCLIDTDESDGRQLGRLSRVRKELSALPALERIVVFEGPVAGERETSLAELREKGAAAHAASPADFAARLQKIDPAEPSHFIYTSGTTGDPKGVMLTHQNWAYEVDAITRFSVLLSSDSVMLFLPLAHVFAQVIKAAWTGLGFRMILAESTDKVLQNLPEARPSILPSVPRVFEKVYNGVLSAGQSAPGLKGVLFRWAMAEFDRYAEARDQGKPAPFTFGLARRLVFSGIRRTVSEKLGGNLRLFVSGGAPLARKIAYFFDALGLPVTEGYGLTEVSAAATIAAPDKIKIGTVGPPLAGTEIKIAQDGEILIRGGGVMKGYYKNPVATAEALTADGWFHTGDIGELDASGYLRITDRKKDLIITAAGKNIAPQNLENELKTFPLISQAMIYGDKRNYLTALLTVSEDAARKLLGAQGGSAGGYPELSARPEVRAAVKQAVDAVNAHQPPYNTIKKFALLDHDLTQEGGELTPTLKVKRKYVTQKYKQMLDALYDERSLD